MGDKLSDPTMDKRKIPKTASIKYADVTAVGKHSEVLIMPLQKIKGKYLIILKTLICKVF